MRGFARPAFAPITTESEPIPSTLHLSQFFSAIAIERVEPCLETDFESAAQ
jgi:hypothetical protein